MGLLFNIFLLNYIVFEGKRSELRKSQRRKPKRTSKNLETITTSKSFIIVIVKKEKDQNIEKPKITTSKLVDHYYENHNVEKNEKNIEKISLV